jgi:MtN3 and saliva related transmembrane protein
MTFVVQVVGLFAVFVSCFNLVPHAMKIHNGGGTHDLSVLSFISILIAGILWLVYGVLHRDWPLVMSNVVQILLALYILYKINMSSPTSPVDDACVS